MYYAASVGKLMWMEAWHLYWRWPSLSHLMTFGCFLHELLHSMAPQSVHLILAARLRKRLPLELDGEAYR